MNYNKKILNFDFTKFKKVEDIIFLDEPILTHYKRNEKDFLFYLVDTLDQSDVFLLFEIDEKLIYNYLTKKISLRTLIDSNQNIAYLVEQDFEGNLLNVDVTQCNSIDENYLPDIDSFLSFEPTKESCYYNFIQEYQSNFYLNLLREKAFYIKFALKNSKYADTIGFNELANIFLSNISLSFKSFLKADFFQSFKNIIGDEAKLSKIFNRLLPELDYRMVDLKFSSFEIGLATDELMKDSIEDKIIKEWSKAVGNKYQEVVLNDFEEQKIKRIINTYGEEDRKKIFSPIFKITENKDYYLSVKPNKEAKYQRIQVRDKSIITRIVPDKIELKLEDDRDFQILNVTMVIDKNKSKKTINLEETLFDSSNNAKVTLRNGDFEKYGYDLNFEITVDVEIKTIKNYIKLIANYDKLEFETTIFSTKLDDGIHKIIILIYEYLINRNESTSE